MTFKGIGEELKTRGEKTLKEKSLVEAITKIIVLMRTNSSERLKRIN